MDVVQKLPTKKKKRKSIGTTVIKLVRESPC